MSREDRSAGTFAEALLALGSHPSIIVLAALEGGPQRLSELGTDNAAVDEETLSAALRELDNEGLVARRVDPGPPLRVLYELTQRGAEIAPALVKLSQWIATRS